MRALRFVVLVVGLTRASCAPLRVSPDCRAQISECLSHCDHGNVQRPDSINVRSSCESACEAGCH